MGIAVIISLRAIWRYPPGARPTMLRSTKGFIISGTYPTAYTETETPAQVSDRRFDDFDAQSEQLSGHDQEYRQLSPGPFSGRFVSAFLGGGVSVHVESANRSLEQRVGCPSGILNIGLMVGGDQPFQVNGVALDNNRLFVTPPGAQIDILSPPGGSILAICIETQSLARWSDRNGANDPLSCLTDRLTVHDAGDLVRGLRGGALHVLRSAVASTADDGRQRKTARVGEHYLSVVLSQFSLHHALGSFGGSLTGSADSRLFDNARTLMLGSQGGELDYDRLCNTLGCSERSIQQAFARNADMSPTGYLRMVRLHKVRRMLLSGALRNASIGDLAARNGFWNWSRFSQSYKHQFGELPSETRRRMH